MTVMAPANSRLPVYHERTSGHPIARDPFDDLLRAPLGVELSCPRREVIWPPADPCRLWHGPIVRDGLLDRCASCGQRVLHFRAGTWLLRGVALGLALLAVLGVLRGLS